MLIQKVFFELTTSQDKVADHIKARVLILFAYDSFGFTLQGSLSEKANNIELIIPSVHFFSVPFPVFKPNQQLKSYIDNYVRNSWELLNKNVDELLCTRRYEVIDNKVFITKKD